MTAARIMMALSTWRSRLETRVVLALGLLLTVGLAMVFVVTTRVVSSQSRARAAVELDIARDSFHALLDERLRSAIAQADLVTQLPVFRAHLTDSRQVEDGEALATMAEEYRARIGADFAIVARPDLLWAASPGWRGEPAADGPLQDALRRALAGTPTGAVVSHRDALYVAASVPARSADGIHGAFTVGFPLNDAMAQRLARLARCEAVIVADGRVVAASLGADLGHRGSDALVALATPLATGTSPSLQHLAGRDYVVGTFAIAGPDVGGSAGRLVLLSDWRPTQVFIDELSRRFAMTGLVVLGLSLLSGLVVGRRVSRPLRDIASAASEIAAGNLHLRLPEQGTLESVAVARAFNEMSVSLRNAQDRLIHDATHDPLTHLPNRALFMERLDRAMIRRKRHPHYCFAVLFIDLDRFKHVNDSLGHGAGDLLLLLFAHRLATAVRRDDTVTRVTVSGDGVEASTLARFGGDEFVVLLDDIRDPIDAVRVAERVQQLSAQPLRVGREDVFTTPSIGVAICTPSHQSAEELVRDADMAMYRAKQTGGNCFAVADAAMHAHAVHRLRLETELRRAVERREFRVLYQPIVRLADRRVVGYEALVRWQHPERGLLAPAEFLPVADEVGLGPQIDEWVLREACRQGREWMVLHPPGDAATISVNLSPRSFAQPTIVDRIAEVLAASGFPPDRLRVEITEGTAIKDPARARVVLTDLRARGVRVSIDDFGTGYSSLSYLQMFPIDVLKIDRSFVAHLGATSSQSEIVQLVIGLAKTLGLDVVAEGAETPAQIEYLTALGCGYGQGFAFAPPLEVSDIAAGLQLPPLGVAPWTAAPRADEAADGPHRLPAA